MKNWQGLFLLSLEFFFLRSCDDDEDLLPPPRDLPLPLAFPLGLGPLLQKDLFLQHFGALGASRRDGLALFRENRLDRKSVV